MDYLTFDSLPREASGYMSVCEWKDFDNNYNECVNLFGKDIVEAYLKIKKIAKPSKTIDAFKVFSRDNQTQEFLKLQPIFYDKSDSWWLWDFKTTNWNMVDEIDILNSINRYTNADIINSKSRTEILNSLKQQGRLNTPKKIEPTWIQFEDMIYDASGKLEPFKATPEYFAVNRIPHKLNKEILTPNIDLLFEQWVGKEYVQTLYEILSYCLLPDYPIHRLFCLIGSGSNGKGCFLRLVEKLVGFENICATELDTLINSRFEIVKLYKKLVCVMGETNFTEINKTSIIKKLTGQDTIGFEHKNKTPFDDKNYAKIIIATNNLPATTDKTDGFYRRWTIIDFPNSFNEEKDVIKEIPEEEYNALVSKCFLILIDLVKNRKFTNEGTIADRMKKYEDKSNPFDKFWKENVKEEPDGDISTKQFRERFDKWCEDNRFRKLSDLVLSKHMKDKNIERIQKRMVWVDSGYGQEKPRYWTWGGIQWIS
jgi:P4 family phage/plasmid primase-like protien